MCPNLFMEEAPCGSILVSDHPARKRLSLSLFNYGWSLDRLWEVRLYIKRRCAKEVSVYVIGCQKL